VTASERADGADGADDAEEAESLPTEPLPWSRAVVAGGAAYLAGFLLTAALFVVGPAGVGGGTLGQRVARMGMVYNNAHGVDVVASELTPVGRRFSFIDLAAASGQSAVPVAVYLAIPIVVLLVAGFLYVRLTAAPAVTTAAMSLGYAGMATLGTLLFRYSEPVEGGTITFTLDGTSALLTGLAFPLLFALPGGLVAVALSRRARR